MWGEFLHFAFVTYTGILINNYRLNNVRDAVVNHKKYIYLNAFYTALKDQTPVFLMQIDKG